MSDGTRTWRWSIDGVQSNLQLVYFQPLECDKVTLQLSFHGELADGSRSCREACRKLKIQGSPHDHENE
jgi:hypothetical protein